MSAWFDQNDIADLREVAEGLHQDSATLLRVQDGAYATIAEAVPCRIFPPGIMRGEYRTLVAHLRGIPVGEIEVSVDNGNALAIDVKDRLRITSKGDQLFEVAGKQDPRTIEIRRKLIVRAINLPERRFYMALAPTGYKGPSPTSALPELVQVLPVPLIVDKPVQAVSEGEGALAGAVRLKQIEVSEIALPFFSTPNLNRLLYCLIVTSDVTPTAAQARDGQFPRYRFNGAASYDGHRWSALHPWCVALVGD